MRTQYGSGWHTVVCGANPTACNHKIVLLYHASARLNSTTPVTFKAEVLGSADVHFVLLVRYHLNSLPAVALQYQQNRKGRTISPTNQYHSRSNTVQSSLSYCPAFSRLEFRHFYKKAGGEGQGGCSASHSKRSPSETHPIMSAPAVLIQRPSPNGFDGRGDSSKRIPDEENALVVVGAFVAAVEEFAVVVMVRKVGECRERTKRR